MPCDVVFNPAEWQAVYLVTQRNRLPRPRHRSIKGAAWSLASADFSILSQTVFPDPRQSGSGSRGPPI